MRPSRALALAALATAVLCTACTGGDEAEPAGGATSEATTNQVSEATKGEACEVYRNLSAQVEAASSEANGVTVSSEEDGQKVTELMTKVSDLTEKADAAYALCYAEGVEPSP